MNRKKEIREISDLPYFKEEYTEILADMGIHDLEDILDALYDEETAEDIAARLKGVGPKIISQWTALLEDLVEEERLTEIVEEAEVPEEDLIEEIEEEEDLIEEEVIIEEEEDLIEEAEGEVLEEGAYVPSPKPELDEGTRALLDLRRERNSRRPRFRRQEWFRYDKLDERWRRPKGIHSKMRRHLGYRPPVVSIGYRGPKKVRGLHSSGFEEVLVHNSDQLEGLNPKTQAVRIGGTVGYRKRLEIESRADELGIHVLNRTG